uniref:Spermatogenesis-associated protein 6 N-terminal domain-containing protein n=1 Tax=Oncorhynchus mykiss TaxID=8022 RepID=A0A8K9UFC5_ONCMY
WSKKKISQCKIRLLITFQVSCPGVHLPAKDDIYLSVCFMSQYRKSVCLPPVFPLLFREKMRFEKVFHYAVDPGDVAEMLECMLYLIYLLASGGWWGEL